jgi:hypothetical protein
MPFTTEIIVSAIAGMFFGALGLPHTLKWFYEKFNNKR